LRDLSKSIAYPTLVQIAITLADWLCFLRINSFFEKFEGSEM
jgi:hypothetical protein